MSEYRRVALNPAPATAGGAAADEITFPLSEPARMTHVFVGGLVFAVNEDGTLTEAEPMTDEPQKVQITGRAGPPLSAEDRVRNLEARVDALEAEVRRLRAQVDASKENG